MATKISLENVIESVENFELDFNFFRISGKASPNARQTFLSIVEFEKYYRSPYVDFISTLNKAEREELSKMDDDEATAYIMKIFLKEDYPTTQKLENNFAEALALNKMPILNTFLSDLIRQAIENKSINIEFVAENDEDGLAIDKKQMLIKEVLEQKNVCDMADLTFDYYQKEIKLTYSALAFSIHLFLEKLK